MTKEIDDSDVIFKESNTIINNLKISQPVHISFTVDVFYAFPHIIAWFQGIFILMWKQYFYAQVRF